MKFLTYIVRRIAFSVFSLIGLSILVFTLSRILPGDPARMAAGPRAPEWVVEQIRAQLNLDKPIYIQYFLWVKDVFRGDLGYSLVTRRSVTFDVFEFLPATLELILLSTIIFIIGSIVLGAIAGRWAYKLPDNVVRAFAYIGVSTPAFVWAIIFQLIFAWWLGWFPTQGSFSEGIIQPPKITGFKLMDSLISGNLIAFKDYLWHMILPSLALAMSPIAQNARIIRMGMVENSGKDFIALAESHGLPDRLIMLKYLFKPSVIPAVTVMGMSIAALLSNAFLVELVFNWPGFSRYAVNAMLNKDLNAIVASVLVIGIVYAVANLIVDVIVAYLDPRIRYMERGE